MNQTFTWLIRVVGIIVIGASLIAYLQIAYLNVQKKPSLLFSEPSMDDLRYKALDKKRANAEFAANRDHTDYEKFGSIIFCNSSFNSFIESANYSKQMDLYISGKDADLSKWDNAIKDYENEKSKCKDFNP